MRIAALVLGILGGLLAVFLGIRWISETRGAEADKTIAAAKALGIGQAEIAQLESRKTSGPLLVGTFVLGIAGGVLALRGKGKPGGGLMVAGAVAPAIFTPGSLIFTFLVLLGGIFAFFSKPKLARA